jgi:hypothetical protein
MPDNRPDVTRVTDLVTPQPPPISSDGPDVWLLVLEDMKRRREEGIAKYGVPVRPCNGRDALVDLYQEILDACVYARQAIEERGRNRRIVVCLCGSTRFKDAFIRANFEETMAGKVVLSVGLFGHADAHVHQLTETEKTALDALHLDKIDMSDEILVINEKTPVCNGCGKPCRVTEWDNSNCCGEPCTTRTYIGDSTRREIEHARKTGKLVRWLNTQVETFP